MICHIALYGHTCGHETEARRRASATSSPVAGTTASRVPANVKTDPGSRIIGFLTGRKSASFAIRVAVSSPTLCPVRFATMSATRRQCEAPLEAARKESANGDAARCVTPLGQRPRLQCPKAWGSGLVVSFRPTMSRLRTTALRLRSGARLQPFRLKRNSGTPSAGQFVRETY